MTTRTPNVILNELILLFAADDFDLGPRLQELKTALESNPSLEPKVLTNAHLISKVIQTLEEGKRPVYRKKGYWFYEETYVQSAIQMLKQVEPQ